MPETNRIAQLSLSMGFQERLMIYPCISYNHFRGVSKLLLKQKQKQGFGLWLMWVVMRGGRQADDRVQLSDKHPESKVPWNWHTRASLLCPGSISVERQTEPCISRGVLVSKAYSGELKGMSLDERGGLRGKLSHTTNWEKFTMLGSWKDLGSWGEEETSLLCANEKKCMV